MGKKKVELKSYHLKGVVEAGCDEAGRGCLAGPVFAAAVILPEDYKNPILNDSKTLSLKKRLLLREEIIRDALAWKVASLDNHEIDKLNIFKAAMKAMHKAVEGLSISPAHLIIDGNRFIPYPGIPHSCVVKGDGKYLSIAAASVLAKTFRDDFMHQLHEIHPEYHWNKNMGYPTKDHKKALIQFGTTPYHRKTFRLIDSQLSLNF